MPTTYLPRPDSDFNAFALHFLGKVEEFWLLHSIDPAMLTALQNAVGDWKAAWPAHIAARAAAEAATQSKDETRRALEAAIRPIANFIQTFPPTTDSDRADIGITVSQPPGGAPRIPTSRPLVRIEGGIRLRHTIRFSDAATPTRRARPKGTLGAEVRLKLINAGEPAPTDPQALTYLTLATSGTAQADFPASDGGKTAVYMLRWVAPRGGVGPWSDIACATVAA